MGFLTNVFSPESANKKVADHMVHSISSDLDLAANNLAGIVSKLNILTDHYKSSFDEDRLIDLGYLNERLKKHIDFYRETAKKL